MLHIFFAKVVYLEEKTTVLDHRGKHELRGKDLPACVCQHTGRSRFSFSVATEIEGSGSSASGSPQTMPTAQRPSRVPGPRTWLGFG